VASQPNPQTSEESRDNHDRKVYRTSSFSSVYVRLPEALVDSQCKIISPYRNALDKPPQPTYKCFLS
jgi:hypothetical protein